MAGNQMMVWHTQDSSGMNTAIFKSSAFTVLNEFGMYVILQLK